MKIKTNTKDDITIFALEGNIMGGDEADKFFERLENCLAEGCKKIILDLSKTTFINSSGIGMFIKTYGIAEKADAELRIAGYSDEVENTLYLTKLYTVIEHHKELSDAVKSF